jgi:DNA primase
MTKKMENEEYLEMRSLQDKYIKTPTVWELSQAFSDCRAIAGRIAYDFQNELKAYDALIAKEPLIKELMQIDDRAIRLKELNQFLNFTRQSFSGKIDQSDIQKAKNTPIQELYSFKISRESRERIQCFCPFHMERTASFFIFKKQNTCHCFSCGFNGDSIDLIRKLKSIDFIESVKSLI